MPSVWQTICPCYVCWFNVEDILIEYVYSKNVPPRNPENLERMRNRPCFSQQCESIVEKFQIFVKFFQIFIKIFLKTFKIFLNLKISIKFPKFVQTLTNFSQITITNPYLHYSILKLL